MRLFRPPYIVRKLYWNRVWRIPSPDSVFLTFDDGPTETTEWILEYLSNENIHATFFCVGDNVKNRHEIYRRIIAEGHEIGNHTMNHLKRNRVSEDDYISSVDDAENHIDSKLFRPPYGRLDAATAAKLRSKGRKIIMWSWLSYDFDKSISDDEIVSNAESIEAGDILVFHDNEKNIDRIKDLLPRVIKTIRKKGLKFEAISF